MTVIAYKDGILVADKRSTDCYMARTSTKIHRAPNGALMGGTGDSGACRALRDWWIAGADTAKWPTKSNDSTLMVITPEGKVLLYWDCPVPVEIEDNFIAIGSGCDYATAAMHLGRSAREAVEIACLFCPSCGNGIDELSLLPQSTLRSDSIVVCQPADQVGAAKGLQ